MLSERVLPLSCEAVYSEGTSAKWYASHSSLCHLLPPLATSAFLSLCPSVYSGWGFFFQLYLFHPNPPTYKTFFYHHTKAAMYFFVSCLLPRLTHVLALCRPRLLHHSPHIPPLLLQAAIMCLSAARYGCEWGPFSIPPAIYLTLGWLQVQERGVAPSPDACDGWEAWIPAGPPKQLLCGSISRTVMERVHLLCWWHRTHVFDEVPDTSVCAERWALKMVVSFMSLYEFQVKSW